MLIVDLIKGYFHTWLEPHCVDCARDSMCPNCENYLLIIEKMRVDYQLLLQKVTNQPEVHIQGQDKISFEPIIKHTPWAAKQRQLEHNDRLEAERLARTAQISVDKNKTTEQLEKELLFGENTEKDGNVNANV